MFEHVLIATDGSEIGNKAISHGIELAKTLGAKLSEVTVTEPYEAAIVPQGRGWYFHLITRSSVRQVPPKSFHSSHRLRRPQVSSVM